jgi:Fe2+ or Zn2+ uptake regulation protein
MDVETVIAALSSKTRRHILRVLSKYSGYLSDALTMKELTSELSQDPAFSVKRRESIYKALEILVKSGLVEKRYEKGRGVCYRLVKTKLEIDLAGESIE